MHESILINEGGGTAKIISYDLGYWLWLASPVALFFVSRHFQSSSNSAIQGSPQNEDDAT
jgi:hypothetical protein